MIDSAAAALLIPLDIVVVCCFYLLPGKPHRVSDARWMLCVGLMASAKTLAILLFAGGAFGQAFVASTLGSLVMFVVFIDENKWKRRWGRLKSRALTGVSQVRFSQQVKEARS